MAAGTTGTAGRPATATTSPGTSGVTVRVSGVLPGLSPHLRRSPELPEGIVGRQASHVDSSGRPSLSVPSNAPVLDGNAELVVRVILLQGRVPAPFPIAVHILDRFAALPARNDGIPSIVIVDARGIIGPGELL
jgi:hypothetical protein